MSAISKTGLLVESTASLVVMDPTLGPVERMAAKIAVGDDVLVQVNRRLCFRPVTQKSLTDPPRACGSLLQGSVTIGRPIRDLLVAEGQRLGVAAANSPSTVVSVASEYVKSKPSAIWFNVAVQEAERIVVEGLLLDKNFEYGLTQIPIIKDSISIVTPHMQIFADNFCLPHSNEIREENELQFTYTIPPQVTMLRVISKPITTQDDGRTLGVAILGFTLDNRQIPLISSNFAKGFHHLEKSNAQEWRWTNGEGLLLLPHATTERCLKIRIASWHENLE